MVTYKPIEGYPNHRVGDNGSVWRRLKGQKGSLQKPARWKEIKPFIVSNNAFVRLNHEGRVCVERLARIVLRAFVGPRPLGFIALRFPDRDPLNCKPSNLRWAPEGAANIGQISRPHFGPNPSRILSKVEVLRIRELARSGEFSAVEIAADFMISRGLVTAVVRGEWYADCPGTILPNWRKRESRETQTTTAILTEPKVKAARKLFLLGLTQKEIAARFGVGRKTISAAIRGETWSHVKITDDQTSEMKHRKAPRPRRIPDRILESAKKLRAEGCTQKEIAERLGVSVPWVSKSLGKKGGGAVGSANSRARLTEEMVREIKAAGRSGDDRQDIARKYSVSRSTVDKIVVGKTWKHVVESLT